MRLQELVSYLDEYLRVREVPDSRVALNGLQVENGGQVTRVAAAVDASEAAIREAVARGCDLLLVHHGLFWDGHRPLTGRRYRKVKRLLDAGVAVYSAHIPLDVHPEVGNNVVLAQALGIRVQGRFGDYEGVELGVWGELELKREALAARLDELLGGPVKLMPGGPEVVRRVGVITGQGGSMIGAAIAAGLDAYVTGEGAHHTYFDAMEGGINVYYGGHYATEVWGVRALAAHLEERFGLPWEFIDLPTGL
ncbi:MAG: Nif3-like dinuclear metal center hexameric protein [bacterium]|jgi:dinuclear metal center YbgI/SA1388 family protein|nr:MAG: Nif3-like dinuclear metal center hexameric protein [bacterium]